MQRHALRVTFFFLILLLTSILVPSIEASLTWNTQQVKEYVWEGGNCPIAIDQSGITHIAYLDGYTLVYASYNGREWTNETIATDAIYLIFDLILDSKGYPHILYEKKFEGPLRIANWDGQVWSIQDTGVSYSDIAALAVDSLGNPSIIYTTFTTNINHDDWAKNTVNTSLIYARWTGTDWDTQIIDTVLKDSLSAISIALSNKSAPYILYSPSSNLNIIKLATSQDSKWRIQDASSEASAGNCGKIVLDSKGYVHFLCTQPYQNSSSLRTILYATFDLTTWSTQTVTSGIEVGTVANLVLDSQDNPHFTFRIYEGDSMYVAFSGDRWQIEKSPVDIGAGNLALDYSGNPQLLYRTGSPARYCSHLIYASAIAGNATSLTSNVPDNTILEVTLAAVVILTIIVIATALQRNRLKNRRKINT